MKKLISWILCLLVLLAVGSTALPSVSADWSVKSYDETEYEEYLAHFANYSKECIDYETISVLGQFKEFSPDVNEDPFPYTHEYYYTLSDENGYTLLLSIQHDVWLDGLVGSDTELSADGMTSLRKHPDGTSGHMDINHCTYYYDKSGELCYIRWESGGVYFQMRLSGIQDIHAEKDTLVTRLLSMDTAQDATQELLEIAQGKRIKVILSYVLGAVILIIVFIIVGDILYRIRRRKKTSGLADT